jgi:hypothetical protein
MPEQEDCPWAGADGSLRAWHAFSRLLAGGSCMSGCIGTAPTLCVSSACCPHSQALRPRGPLRFPERSWHAGSFSLQSTLCVDRYIAKPSTYTIGFVSDSSPSRYTISSNRRCRRWLFFHILNLVGFRNRTSVLLQWADAYLTCQRGMRLVTGVDVEATRASAGCASRPTVGPFAQREDQPR